VAAFLSIASALISLWQGHPGRWSALLAAVLLVAVVSTFYLYFQKANASFTAASISDVKLGAELTRWATWHWWRVGLSFAAFVAAMMPRWHAGPSPITTTGGMQVLPHYTFDSCPHTQTHHQILHRIISGTLVHADETHITVQGRRAYVWVFTNMHEVAYLYSGTREGGLAQATLDQFQGVLVSDFYAVFDSLNCPQQKCLIHLVRDLNGAILDNPYDQEIKQLVRSFGELLKRIVEEVDRRGLKAHFLRKYLRDVIRFYREHVDREYQSPAAIACAERFRKNRDKLFTFLEYNGVPWNNNSAEHAMKAFARLRDVIEGMATEKGLKEYLVLLSVCQTCKYMGADFLDFLRSGEKEIHAFANNRPLPRRGKQTGQPAACD
jgi:hypothetical protein